MDHSPSGSFDPTIDSFGRVIFTRWDHLQRDQQADADAGGPTIYGTFDYASESAFAAKTLNKSEIFPEPRRAVGTVNGHTINHFFPWMINQDGSGVETLNHIGRHELHGYFNRAFSNDENLSEFIGVNSGRTNPNRLFNMLQIMEDGAQAGRYVAVEAPEFQTHASGQIIAMVAPPEASADQIVVEYLTHPDTNDVVADGALAVQRHGRLAA